MPVALLNEIVLAAVGFILGYKASKKESQIRSWFNRVFTRKETSC